MHMHADFVSVQSVRDTDSRTPINIPPSSAANQLVTVLKHPVDGW
jgi:hypothetical protein